MLIHILLLTLSWPAFTQNVPNCDEHLQAFTEWEIKLQGQMVPRVDYFEIPDWDPNSQFDGVVITPSIAKTIKKPVFEVEFRPKNAKDKSKKLSFSKTVPFSHDRHMLYFSEFKPKEFFTFEQAGSFEVRLKDGETLLCRYTRPYNLGD